MQRSLPSIPAACTWNVSMLDMLYRIKLADHRGVVVVVVFGAFDPKLDVVYARAASPMLFAPLLLLLYRLPRRLRT